MFVRYGLAAVLAALATLMGNVVWAQETWPQGGAATGYAPVPCSTYKPYCDTKDCCATDACCKDGKCCKDGECCCKGKKCEANCTCCKDNKCECGKGGECCCKDGKCCCKDKTVKKTGHDSCPFLSKLAKSTTIIMVMPSSLPLLGACHPEMMGMLPHPPLPMGPQVMMPTPFPPPPPMLTPPGLPVPGMSPPVMPPHTIAMPVPPSAPCYPCPTAMPFNCSSTPEAAVAMSKANTQIETCLQLLGLASELCSLVRPLNTPFVCASALELLMEMCPTTYAQTATPYVMHPPQCIGTSPPMPQQQVLNVLDNGVGSFCGLGCCPVASSMCAATPCVAPCAIAKPATETKVRIIAMQGYDDQLEMNVGDDTCIRCKKMTVKIGDNEITLSRFDDRVRVRGEELKATADSVRSDQKERLILEGDVVLHYKKDGHSANVTGDCIELNLSSGAVTIKPAAKTMVRPSVRIDRVDTDE